MDHTTIEDQNLVERYVLGRLTLAERERFEAHFLDCPSCLSQLEWTEDMHGALRTAAAEDAARTLAAGGVLAFLARRSRGARVALGLAVLAVPLAVSLAFFLPRVHDLERRMERAERTAAVAQGEPQVDVASVLLGVLTRGGELTGEVTLLKISEPQRVMLEVDAKAAFASYRATLVDAAGEQIWQSSLRPNPWAVLEVTFPAGFFQPGDYRLDFAGSGDDGQAVDLGSFPLRAEP